MEEAVEFCAEVDECGLDGAFDIGDAADIDVVDAGDFVGVFGEDIFELAIFEDGDAAVFSGDIVDDHFGVWSFFFWFGFWGGFFIVCFFGWGDFGGFFGGPAAGLLCGFFCGIVGFVGIFGVLGVFGDGLAGDWFVRSFFRFGGCFFGCFFGDFFLGCFFGCFLCGGFFSSGFFGCFFCSGLCCFFACCFFLCGFGG